MKPASFEYFAPTNLAEALENIAQVGDDGGKILAGGQSLVPAMNFRMAQPTALVDLNKIAELFYIKPTQNGGLKIGAMTRDRVVELDTTVKQRAPIIPECLYWLAHPTIRNRGTFGGALAHSDPAGQLPVVAAAMQFKFHLQSKKADRWVDVDDFFVSVYTTCLEADEILTEIEVPAMNKMTGYSFKQVSRQSGESALVGVASILSLDESGIVKDGRIAYMGVAEKPVLASEAMGMLKGNKPTDELIADAINATINNELDPGADIHASIDFRKHLARELGIGVVKEAIKRASK
jgi:aerobic carbon-monoxide dehydrogenase medium subunit